MAQYLVEPRGSFDFASVYELKYYMYKKRSQGRFPPMRIIATCIKTLIYKIRTWQQEVLFSNVDTSLNPLVISGSDDQLISNVLKYVQEYIYTVYILF
jgi:hypothetical protein